MAVSGAHVVDAGAHPSDIAIAEKPEVKLVDTIHGFATDVEHVSPGYFTSKYFLGSYAAACMSFLGGLGGFGLIAPVLNEIDVAIGPSPNIIWVALIYTLGLAVGLALMGRITDIFGRRWFLVGGSLLGTIGAIVCSRANSIPTLIGGELLVGIAGTVAYSFGFVVSELVPMQYRFLSAAGLFAFALPTNGFGPAISTAFILHTKAGWRWCYYFLIIVNGITTLLWFFFYYPPNFHMKHTNETMIHVLKKFDYVGAVMFVAGVTLFLIGLSWGGSVYPWTDAHVVATIVVGGILMICLIIYNAMVPLEDPFVPLYLFKQRGYFASMMLLALGATVYYTFAVIWPSMVTVVYANGDAVWAGWVSCIIGLGISAGEIIGGTCARFVGKVRYQCLVAIASATIFLGGECLCSVCQV
jgi:MFS family permease